MKKGLIVLPAILVTLLACNISVTFADSSKDRDKHADKHKICGSPSAILSKADFDGNGVVDSDDVLLFKKVKKRKQYFAFYDLNADGKLNDKDLKLVRESLGASSTKLDQEMAKLFHQVKQFGVVNNFVEMKAMGQRKFIEAFAGHGEHWLNSVGADAIAGRAVSQFYRPEGVNVSIKDKKPWGLFWGQAAVPIFANGATDFPTGSNWLNSQVVGFKNEAPKFTSSNNEVWHAHGGLCVTTELIDGVTKLVANQNTTFLECQGIPSTQKLGTAPSGAKINAWVNLWMVHIWLFDLNPNGLFAGHHACLDTDSPPPHSINGDRNVPDFFQAHAR